MAEVIELIAIAWLSNLLVSLYINRCIQKKIRVRKPFGCQKCLGFWVGLAYFATVKDNPKEIIIFALITSILAALTNGIIKRVNGTGV